MSMKITVLGAGYLGATHAAGMAELGHDVLALDIDHAKISRLAQGEAPFYEPGLNELLRKHTMSGRLRFTASFAEAGAFGDIHFLAVGTPQSAGGHAADLRFLDAAVDALAPHLVRPCLVAGKSTVPVGTSARLTSLLSERAPAGSDVEMAWNPEFLREGHAVADTLRPDRIVIGTNSPRAERSLRCVYASALASGTPVIVTDPATAELVKVAANSFLATKISFINAMAEVCEAAGADVHTLARAIGHDARIGHRFLGAGVGFGGGCLPKDIRAFRARAQELGVGAALDFLTEVDRVNQRSRERVLALAAKAVGGNLAGRRVAVLGAAFKPNTDDVRDSPALAVATEALRMGAHVAVYDPMATTTGAAAHPELEFVHSMEDAVDQAEVVLLLTEWDEFRHAEPRRLASRVSNPVIVDGRHVLDPQTWAAAGWTVLAPGRPAVHASQPVEAPKKQPAHAV